MAVKTEIIKISPERVELDKIRIIAKVLQGEGIIAYPTDTFYGLGASCFSEKAIQRIYHLKKRNPSKPISVLVSGMEMIQKIAVDIPSLLWKLTADFWPGPLTLVLKASSDLPRAILGPRGSIGVRQPALSWLRELVNEATFPITATSANLSGDKEITDPDKVLDLFYGKVDIVADGGETRGILPSTVIDITSQRLKILREGAVPRSLLEKYL